MGDANVPRGTLHERGGEDGRVPSRDCSSQSTTARRRGVVGNRAERAMCHVAHCRNEIEQCSCAARHIARSKRPNPPGPMNCATWHIASHWPGGDNVPRGTLHGRSALWRLIQSRNHVWVGG
jgi:hypothetical protein